MNATCTVASLFPTLVTYMTSLITEQTSYSPPIQFQDEEHFDFIVVGAGTTGCVVANRLSEISDWSVLLLEAGGEEPYTVDIPSFVTLGIGSSMDWNFKTVPQKNSCGGDPCTWPRGKTLGGTSALNGLIYNRGNSHDFDHWAQLGNEGWCYENVLHYYKKSENNLDPDIANDTRYHAVGGYLSVGRYPYQDKNAKALYDAFREIGYNDVDFNTETHTGVMSIQAMQRNGYRQSSNRAFIDPIRHKRPNLKVVTNVRVTKVLIHPENKTVYGVEYALEKDRTQTGKFFAKKEVILSAGFVNSPHILMLSGVGPKDVLTPLNIPVLQDLHVGQNLRDHFTAPGAFFMLNEEADHLPTNEDILIDSIKYSSPQRGGPWSSISATTTSAKINTKFANTSIDNPDVEIFFVTENTCSKTASPLCYYNIINFHTTVLRPKSVGYITINTTDPFVQPLIYPNYFSHPDDIDAILDSLNVAIKMSNTKALKDAGITLNATFLPTREDLESGTNPLWKPPKWFTFHHQSGTCKMGPNNDPTAVVDPQLKVYGIHGLRVADTSIMPQVTSGNTHAPCIMIGEKAADMIKRSWDK